MKKNQTICLTFDIEEFDTPRVDYHVPLPLARQLDISREGVARLLDMLAGMGVSVTFFVTGVFANAYPALVRRMVSEGHEVASHSYSHTEFRQGDYTTSKEVLEKITQRNVVGYRSPRMAGADAQGLSRAGYRYDSSTNPCFLPGKYNNFGLERRVHRQGSMVEIPASVATFMRVPLFWLSLHLMPLSLYFWLCGVSGREVGFLNLYFHPWEFSEEIHNKDLRVPFYIRRNAGDKLLTRLAMFIDRAKGCQARFITMNELADSAMEVR
ncbi:MAG: polysaccharide deacetylase family protein [Mucinivorans sp.]